MFIGSRDAVLVPGVASIHSKGLSTNIIRTFEFLYRDVFCGLGPVLPVSGPGPLGPELELLGSNPSCVQQARRTEECIQRDCMHFQLGVGGSAGIGDHEQQNHMTTWLAAHALCSRLVEVGLKTISSLTSAYGDIQPSWSR